MENQNNTFQYTYSPKHQEEVKKIRRKYLRPEEDKMEQLKKLDKSTEKSGTIAALVVGTLGTLLLGIGMCCTMVYTNFFVIGIVIGVVGIIGISLAYPLFKSITRKNREKLAPQILKISDELIGQQ